MFFEGRFKANRVDENGSWIVLAIIPKVRLKVTDPTPLGRRDLIQSYFSLGCVDFQCFLSCRNDPLVEQEEARDGSSSAL